MKEGEGIKKWLAILILIIIAAILALVVFLPILIGKINAESDSDFIIDLQIGRPQAVIIGYPTHLDSPRAAIDLIAAPFITDKGVAVLAIRDLEKLLDASISWNPKRGEIKIVIPSGIISKNDIQLLFTVGKDNVFIKNDRAFIPIRSIAKLLLASEIVWAPETNGIRLIWYN